MESEKIKELVELCAEHSIHYDIDDDGMVKLTLEVYPKVVQQCLTLQEITTLSLNTFRDILRMKIKVMEDAIRRG